MENELLLLSGNDIPYAAAGVVIHQPSLKEIAYLGEEVFFTGCEFLNFSKDMLTEEDKSHLESYSNFDILMSIMKEKNATVQKNKLCIEMVLSLIFPTYQIEIKSEYISLVGQDEVEHQINNDNFEDFKDILVSMFRLTKRDKSEYQPMGEMAKKIADKLKKRHQKLAESKEKQKIAILSRYISILATGQKKDINALFQYTVYQLFDEFSRFQLKTSYDIYVQARMAGAKDMKDPEDWMKDLYEDKIEDDLRSMS